METHNPDCTDTMNDIGGRILVYSKEGLIIKPKPVISDFEQLDAGFEQELEGFEQESAVYLGSSRVLRGSWPLGRPTLLVPRFPSDSTLIILSG